MRPNGLGAQEPFALSAIVLMRRSARHSSVSIVRFALRNEDENRQHDHDEAESRLLTVPNRGLPHLEPLASNHKKTHEPNKKTNRAGNHSP